MYSLQIRKLIVISVDTDAEEQARIAPIDDFERAEFDKVGLVFLVARRDEAVDFAFQFDFLLILGRINDCIQ